jgi:hypothetical protein
VEEDIRSQRRRLEELQARHRENMRLQATMHVLSPSRSPPPTAPLALPPQPAAAPSPQPSPPRAIPVTTVPDKENVSENSGAAPAHGRTAVSAPATPSSIGALSTIKPALTPAAASSFALFRGSTRQPVRAVHNDASGGVAMRNRHAIVTRAAVLKKPRDSVQRRAATPTRRRSGSLIYQDPDDVGQKGLRAGGATVRPATPTQATPRSGGHARAVPATPATSVPWTAPLMEHKDVVWSAPRPRMPLHAVAADPKAVLVRDVGHEVERLKHHSSATRSLAGDSASRRKIALRAYALDVVLA